MPTPANRPLALSFAFLGSVVAAACAAGDRAEGDRIVELLDVRPGASVADVGAGDGDWIHHLLEAVGPDGRVWATEVDPDLVAELREDHADDPVEVVAGTQTTTGLPADCCDAILLRLVYHHFEEPAVMLADLDAALRPGGRLLLVETDLQEDWSTLPDVPDRGGHGIPFERLAEELAAHGWTILSSHRPWDDDGERFAVVTAPEDDSGGSAGR